MATYVAVFALVLAYVATVGAYLALRTLSSLRRDTRLLAKGTNSPAGQVSLIEATNRHAELTATVAEQLEALREREGRALRNVALVRYDAFGEMSGRMSFSLALLDDSGAGVAISAITGRTDTRVYAKAVDAGARDLSPEERQAVDAAMRSELKRAG